MKKLYTFLMRFWVASIILVPAFTQAGALTVVKHLQSSDSLLSVTVLEKQLKELKKEREDTVKLPKLTGERAELRERQKALTVQAEEAKGVEQDFIKKKLSLVTQRYQALGELEQVRTRYVALLEEHIKLLEDYRADPDFKKFNVPVKASYTFDEFEDLGRRLLYIRKILADYEKSQAVAFDDLQKLKKTLLALDQEALDKEKQQKDFAQKPQNEGFNRVQSGELIDLEKQLIDDKKAVTEVKIKETDQRTILLDTEIMIVRGQLEQLKASYERVKNALYIDEAYLKKVENNVEEQRRILTQDSEETQKNIHFYAAQEEAFEKKIKEAASQLDLSSGDELAWRDWSKTPQDEKQWRALCSIGYLGLEASVSDVKHEYNEAIREFEKAKLKKAEVQLAIIRSWNVISKRRLGFNQALEQQIKSYDAPKTDIQSTLASLKEKRARATGRLQPFLSIQEHIEKFTKLLEEDKLGLKESQPRLYKICSERIKKSKEKVQDLLNSTTKLIETYAQAIVMLEESAKRIENVVSELGSKSFWRRSDQSITWYELKNFFPDIRRFFDDIASGFQRTWQGMNWHYVKHWFGQWFSSVSSLLLLVLRILIFILLYWALSFYLPEFQTYLTKNSGYFARSNIRLLASTLLHFINTHFTGLYIWTVGYILISFGVIDNVYLALVFYLASIPYMLWIFHSFFTYVAEENKKLSYIFISESYTSRFMLIVPLLVYITIGITFFRKAFLIGNYHASAVPAILNAFNFIIFQLALMGLISKEWILSWIPQKSLVWEWVYERVNRYYYILWVGLVAIIVMSNPYVGYGRQVWFVLSRSLIVAILIPLLSYLYGKVRQTSVDLFFYSAEGGRVKERFASARAWYGFFIIIAFFSFILIGILVTVNVWGYSIGLRDVYTGLNYTLYETVGAHGRKLPITPLKFGKFILAFVVGLFAAYAFNRIFLKKIFDPLLITSGVQNTIFTLSRYVIVFIALLIGMRSIGLQSVANTLALVGGALSFAFRDQLVDFFAYFIILVQRPIKIGDLIKLEDGTIGIVRHVTPRSVVMRQKNSVTIIVPNSYIITKAVTNWMYTTTFSGLPDMHLTFPYRYEPGEIKSIIFKVLDSNPNLLKSPSPIIRLEAFRDIGFDIMIRAFVSGDKVLDQWDIASSLRIELLKVLNEHGISIAEQTRVVRYIQEAPGQGTISPPSPSKPDKLPEN